MGSGCNGEWKVWDDLVLLFRLRKSGGKPDQLAGDPFAQLLILKGTFLASMGESITSAYFTISSYLVCLKIV